MNKILSNHVQLFEDQALSNLRQISDTPWPYHQGGSHNNPNKLQQNSYSNTLQSIQLPLHPKNPHYLHKQVENQYNRKRISSLTRQRPHTIHNEVHQHFNQTDRHSKRKCNPLTSLNFYEGQATSNTFDNRSKLNQQIEICASRIKHQTMLLKSIDAFNGKTFRQSKQNTIRFKMNVARRSVFYQQFKTYLVNSFKVDGKPVNIRQDKFSIDFHGLPKKRSVYSYKKRNDDQFFSVNRTEMVKKSKRYNINNQQQSVVNTSLKNSLKRQTWRQSFLNQTMHVRQSENSDRLKQKGKLWIGRPPSQVVAQEEQKV